MVSFKTAVKNGFRNAFYFSGRATRAEYWWFQLFMLLSTWGLMGLLMVICIIFRIHNEESIILWGAMIYWMIMIMPNLSLQIRRLHDTDHSGWNLLWCLVPLINYIAPFYILYLMCKKGSQEDNLYGPSPYETDKDRMNENSEDM